MGSAINSIMMTGPVEAMMKKMMDKFKKMRNTLMAKNERNQK